MRGVSETMLNLGSVESLCPYCVRDAFGRHQQRGWFPPHLCSGLWTLGTPRNWQFAKLVENIISELIKQCFFLCFFVFWGSKWVSKLWKNVDINYYLYRESDRYSESCELTWFWISQAESSCPRYGRSTIDDLKTYQVCVHKDCQHLHRFFLNVSYVSWCLQKVAQFWNNLLKTNSLPLKMGHSQRRKGLPCTSSLTQLSGALSCMFCMVNGWPLWCVWKCYVTRRCMFLAPCAWSSMPWFFFRHQDTKLFPLAARLWPCECVCPCQSAPNWQTEIGCFILQNLKTAWIYCCFKTRSWIVYL